MAKDCSELATLLYESARYHASRPGVDTVDKVVEEIQKSGIDVDRELFINSIAEASAARARDLTQAQKQIAAVMREARTDKKLTDKLEKLQQHLEEGTLPAKQQKKATQYSDVRKTLRADIAAVNKALSESEPALKQKLSRSIAELTERLAENDFARPVKIKDVPSSREVEDLEYEQDKLRKEVQKRIRDAAPKKWYEQLAHYTGLQKALVTTGDLAPALRQGILFTMARPVKSGENWLKSLEAIFGGDEAADRIQKSILERDSYPEMRRANLVQRDWSGQLDNATENFASKWLMPSDWKLDPRRIPAALSRGFTTYTNLVRADLFDMMQRGVLKRGGGTQEDLDAIARVANYATGDIHMGKVEALSQPLSLGFFSPRYWASQLMTEVTPFIAAGAEAAAPVMRLAGKDVKVMGSSAARRAILELYARAGAGMLSALFAAALGTGGDRDEIYEEFRMTIDPRSPYFLKPKIMGMRHDISGGLAKHTALISKAVLGSKLSKKGDVVAIRGDDAAYKEDDAVDLSTRMIRGKLAVLPSTAADLATGKNIVGDDVTVLGSVGNMVFPMSPKDIVEVAQTQGMDKPMSTLVSTFLTLLGSAPYVEKSKPGGKIPDRR